MRAMMASGIVASATAGASFTSVRFTVTVAVSVRPPASVTVTVTDVEHGSRFVGTFSGTLAVADASTLQLTDELVEVTEGRFEAAGGGIEWLAGGREYALVEHVWSALGFVAPAPLALELEAATSRTLVDI